jgi:hypothetical protein
MHSLCLRLAICALALLNTQLLTSNPFHNHNTLTTKKPKKRLPNLKIYHTESTSRSKAAQIDRALARALVLLGYTAHYKDTYTLYNDDDTNPDLTVYVSLEEQSPTTYLIECVFNDASSERTYMTFRLTAHNTTDFNEAISTFAHKLRAQILGIPATSHQHPRMIIKSPDGGREICAELKPGDQVDFLPIGQSYAQIFSIIRLANGGFVACVDQDGARHIVHQPTSQPQRTLALPCNAYYPQITANTLIFLQDCNNESRIGLTPLDPLLHTGHPQHITYIPTTPHTTIQTSPTSNKYGKHVLFLARANHTQHYQIYSYNTTTHEVSPIRHNPAYNIIHILCSPEEQLLAAVIETQTGRHALALLEYGQIVQCIQLEERCVDIRWAPDSTGLFILTTPLPSKSSKKQRTCPLRTTLSFVSRFNMHITPLEVSGRCLGIGAQE